MGWVARRSNRPIRPTVSHAIEVAARARSWHIRRMSKLGVVLAVLIAIGCSKKIAPRDLVDDKAGSSVTPPGRGFDVTGNKGGEPTDLVTLGDMIATGAIDKDVVRRVVRDNLAKLQYCYEKTLLVNPGIEGRVLVTFTIAIEGSVSDVTAAGIHPEVEACVAEKVRTFKFPRPDAGKVEVSYPFTFKPA